MSLDKPLNLAESVSSFQNNKGGGVICIFRLLIFLPVYIYIYAGIYICTTTLSIHLSDGHIDCFQVLAIVNSGAVNIEVHVFF